MHDGTIDYTPVHKVEPLGLPLRCQRCRGNNAHWAVDGSRMCHLCLLETSALDEHYEIDLFHAVICPELLEVSTHLVRVRIFQTTCLAPICAMLNTLFDRYPSIDLDAEIHIELWYARGIGGRERSLTFEGEGWFCIESTTDKCHAPIVRLARAPRGRMAGFMNELNTYSMRIRDCVSAEFAEEETANG
jgi:hypothetical protein